MLNLSEPGLDFCIHGSGRQTEGFAVTTFPMSSHAGHNGMRVSRNKRASEKVDLTVQPTTTTAVGIFPYFVITGLVSRAASHLGDAYNAHEEEQQCHQGQDSTNH